MTLEDSFLKAISRHAPKPGTSNEEFLALGKAGEVRPRVRATFGEAARLLNTRGTPLRLFKGVVHRVWQVDRWGWKAYGQAVGPFRGWSWAGNSILKEDGSFVSYTAAPNPRVSGVKVTYRNFRVSEVDYGASSLFRLGVSGEVEVQTRGWNPAEGQVSEWQLLEQWAAYSLAYIVGAQPSPPLAIAVRD